MKVVHLHRMRGVGGSERHLLALLPALRTRGVDAAFVGLDDPAHDSDPFYELLDAPAERLACPRDLDPLLLRRVRATLKRLKPDVVHTHLVHADVYGTLAALGTRAAVVSTKHNDDPFRAGPFRHLERLLARRVDRVIAITDALARFSVERGGLPAGKVDVVHYGLAAAEPWGESAAPPPGGPLLLSVSRLVPQKGLDVALRALAPVRERVPDARLAVLGEGPERAPLQALAGELGLADAVLLPGRVADVRGWLDAAELLVHPARWEGFGLALLEAMLAAKPVVATRVSSIPEIVVDGETGYVVPPDDAAAVAAAIVRLLEDDALRARLGAAGLERARREFSVDRMADATLAVYERALASRRA
jgi:glycosyltransferase involved in cell wall biosynthesis